MDAMGLVGINEAADLVHQMDVMQSKDLNEVNQLVKEDKTFKQACRSHLEALKLSTERDRVDTAESFK